jgi:peroxiredoxin
MDARDSMQYSRAPMRPSSRAASRQEGESVVTRLAAWRAARVTLTPLRVALAALTLAAVVLGVIVRVGAPAATPQLAGSSAPPFALRTEAGGAPSPHVVSLAEQRGHPVLLLFTYSLCAHCLAETAAVAQLESRYGPMGLRVLYIDSPAESPGIIAAFAQRVGVDAPVLLDTGGALAQHYGIQAYPAALLIDGNGVVRAQWTGETGTTALRAALTAILPAGT